MAEADMDLTLPITVVVTTYFGLEAGPDRLGAVKQTISSWLTNLLYKGGLHLIVVHDGGDCWQAEDLANFLALSWTGIKRQPTNTISLPGRGGVGRSLNEGFRRAFETSPLVAYFVDDWALTQRFDLTPWAQLLMEREDVGLVRLGPPHPGVAGVVNMFTDNWQGWALRLYKHQGFAFAHRPALYHRRMIDTYGWFEEGVSALECERRYNEKVNSVVTSVDIVQALPHPWQHLDTPSLSALEPA